MQSPFSTKKILLTALAGAFAVNAWFGTFNLDATALAAEAAHNPYFAAEMRTGDTIAAKRSVSEREAKAFFQKVVKREYIPPFAAPAGFTHTKEVRDGVKVEILKPKKPGRRVILQFHGGGYVLGLQDTYRYHAVLESKLADKATVYMLDYPLAPEHQYPTQLNQAVSLYESLLAEGIKAKNIVVLGDSAGANLTLTFALALKERGLEQPAGLVVVSPWGTMDNTLPTRIDNFDYDKVLGKGTPLSKVVANPNYTTEENKDHPLVSPIYGDYTGIAPMLVQAGGDELFLSDAAEVVAKAQAAGVDAKLTVYPAMSHVFQMVLPYLEDSQDAMAEMRRFIKRVTK